MHALSWDEERGGRVREDTDGAVGFIPRRLSACYTVACHEKILSPLRLNLNKRQRFMSGNLMYKFCHCRRFVW